MLRHLMYVSFHTLMSGIVVVQIGSERPAQRTKPGEGAAHPDKVLFSPRRIYLGGEDKGDRAGTLRSIGQARPEW